MMSLLMYLCAVLFSHEMSWMRVWDLIESVTEGFFYLFLKHLHDDQGLQGHDRTLSLVRQRFYWPGLEADVQHKVKTCVRCIQRKTVPKPSAELVNISTIQPVELVCIDILSLERSKGGHENILVITHHFTRYAQTFPTKNQLSKTVLFDNFEYRSLWIPCPLT